MLSSQHSSDEGAALRRYLRDLVALSALPAAWIGQSTQAIVESFSTALLRTLQVDFVYARVVPAGEPEAAIEVACTDSGLADPRRVRDLPTGVEMPIAYAGRTMGVVAVGSGCC